MAFITAFVQTVGYFFGLAGFRFAIGCVLGVASWFMVSEIVGYLMHGGKKENDY
jgi:type IV secretory pathway VirB2 component (pilin)